MIKKLILLSALVYSQAHASVTCSGTIERVYKWHNMERISVLLSSANRWINMPTKSDESMALMAFAANKSVQFHWSAADVTSCENGWTHNRSFQGWWAVNK